MNGLFFAGTALGCIFSAWVGTVFGRLKTIQCACIVCIIGGALMAGSVNVGMYLSSRFIMGWGVGMMVCGGEHAMTCPIIILANTFSATIPGRIISTGE